jgi:hypothetical protein
MCSLSWSMLLRRHRACCWRPAEMGALFLRRAKHNQHDVATEVWRAGRCKHLQAVRSCCTTSATARQPRAPCLHTRCRHSLAAVCDLSPRCCCNSCCWPLAWQSVLLSQPHRAAASLLPLLGIVDCCPVPLPPNRTRSMPYRPSPLPTQHAAAAATQAARPGRRCDSSSDSRR